MLRRKTWTLNMPDYKTSFDTGFIKAAQTAEIPDGLIRPLLKVADLRGFGLSLANNPISHALTAASPMNPNIHGFKDYFTGMKDRFGQAQDNSNVAIADNKINEFQTQMSEAEKLSQPQGMFGQFREAIQPGYHRGLQTAAVQKAQPLMEDAYERSRWAQSPELKTQFADRLNGITGDYNKRQDIIHSSEQAQQAARAAQEKALNEVNSQAYNKLKTPQLAAPGQSLPQPKIPAPPARPPMQPSLPKPPAPATPSSGVRRPYF